MSGMESGIPPSRYDKLASEILELARLIKSSGEWREAVHLLEHCAEMLKEHPKIRARLLALYAELLWKRGDIELAEQLLDQQAPDIDPRTLSDILYEFAEVHYILKYFMLRETDEDPLALHEEALRLRREAGYMEGVSESLSRIGTMYEHQGDYEAAQPYYEEGIEVAESIGYTHGLLRPYTHMAAYQRTLGNHDESYRLYSESLRLSEEAGGQETIMFSLANMAQAEYASSGDLEKALSLDAKALEIAGRTGFILGHARVLLGIALLHMQAGDNEKAINHFRKVLEVAEAAGYSYFTKPAQDYIEKLV